MRRIRYAVATSLDGYLAGPRGAIDWITMDPEINFVGISQQFDTVEFLYTRVKESANSKERLVFVSHSSVDTWIAKQVAREIEDRGAIPFLDEAQVDAGADFEEDILNFLERAHELVVLLTPWALDRPYVWAEIGAAWGRRIPIVALLLGLTPTELQTRPGIPVLLKKRDLLQLNEIETYLDQLAARTKKHQE